MWQMVRRLKEVEVDALLFLLALPFFLLAGYTLWILITWDYFDFVETLSGVCFAIALAAIGGVFLLLAFRWIAEKHQPVGEPVRFRRDYIMLAKKIDGGKLKCNRLARWLIKKCAQKQKETIELAERLKEEGKSLDDIVY